MAFLVKFTTRKILYKSRMCRNYVKLVLPLKSNNDKDRCYKLLTINELCQEIYDIHIRVVIDQSDYVLIRHLDGEINAFAFVQIQRKAKKNNLDVLLVYTISNEKLGSIIAHDIYGFALKKKCKKIYTSPRNPELRNIFLKHRYRHHLGVEGYSEVLVKDVISLQMNMKCHIRGIQHLI